MTRKPANGANTTWGLRGVEPETRAASQIAARKAGVPVGRWVNNVLIRAATEEAKHDAVPAPRLEDVLNKIVERLETVEKRTAHVSFWRRMLGA